VTVALASALLAGCGAGFAATATKPYAPGDGTMGNTGDLRVLNALVVASQTGTSGVVSATVVNRGDRRDRLTGLTSPNGTVDLTGPGLLPVGGALRLGAGTATSATISGLTRLPGETITLRFTFAKAPPLRLVCVVVPPTGPYASITPQATPPTG
jgi:hypothetical protein